MSGSQTCRDSPHVPIEKEMCHLKAEKNKLNHSGCLLSQILFHCLFAYVICIFFLFYYPTLSLLCMFQGSTKNVNANLSGNLYGATYIFSSLASLARYLRH